MTAAVLLTFVAGCETAPATHRGEDALGRPHDAKYGNVKVHYVTAGTGLQTVVFVHCWGGNLGMWRNEVPALEGKARLILMDLPGCGESDKPRTNYSMEYYAGAVLAVMRDAEVEKATLVGHSMGTPVICEVCATAPEKVAGLVAVDGTLRKGMGGAGAEEFMAPFNGPDYRQAVTNVVKSMFPAPGTDEVRKDVTAEMLQTPQYVLYSSLRGMFGPEAPDWNLRHVSVPVVCINTDNPMWGDDYRNYVRGLSPLTDYRTITGAGHWLMLEKPDEFNLALTDALRKYGLIGE